MDQTAAGGVPPQDDVDALEKPEEGQTSIGQSSAVTNASGQGNAPKEKQKSFLQKFNIYLLFFGLLMIVALVIVAIAYFQSKKSNASSSLANQTLSESALQQVANSDSNVGNTQQVLNIESSAVFAGKVLLRDGEEVAGSLDVGGTTALNDLTVSSTAAFGQVQVNQDLSLAGNAGFQGGLTVAKSLQVGGTANFSGQVSAPQLTVGTLQLNNDLTLTHHIVAGGTNPGRTNGTALGTGGTVSVSGSDTSGSITVNTGSNPPAGCFVTINFSQPFNATPHVIISPVGQSAAGIAYYVTRNTAGFTVCDNGTPPTGATFGFDYIVFD